MFCQGACSLLYILVYELAGSPAVYIFLSFIYTYILIKKNGFSHFKQGWSVLIDFDLINVVICMELFYEFMIHENFIVFISCNFLHNRL
jgi:hypothetical protein